jgi:hypothetical protein
MLELALCFHKSVGGGFLFFIFTDDKKRNPLNDGAKGEGAKRGGCQSGGKVQ